MPTGMAAMTMTTDMPTTEGIMATTIIRMTRTGEVTEGTQDQATTTVLVVPLGLEVVTAVVEVVRIGVSSTAAPEMADHATTARSTLTVHQTWPRAAASTEEALQILTAMMVMVEVNTATPLATLLIRAMETTATMHQTRQSHSKLTNNPRVATPMQSD